MTSSTHPVADIGIIGGSGFYSFLSDAEQVSVGTPFGAPSDEVTVGEVAGRRVAFLPRHGRDHRFPPHRVPYQANLWALRYLGVRQVLAPCAVGSLRVEHGPGTLVVPDQVIDRTWGRRHTVYDGAEGVAHVSFADPYCPHGRAALLASAGGSCLPVVDGGTLLVINGPRFSSRAESRWHRAAGGTVVGMTGMPEASIARELAMCYSTACVVTDHDAGVEGQQPVTQDAVLAAFAGSIEALKDVLRAAVSRLPEEPADGAPACACRPGGGADLPIMLPGAAPSAVPSTAEQTGPP